VDPLFTPDRFVYIPNLHDSNRAFLRNPNKYPDPDNFRPERWLEPGWPTYQEPLTQFPAIKGMSSFGWGQRQCLGMSLTQDELLVACGTLAWTFTLKRKRDPITGNFVDVPLDKSNSLLIIKPDSFQMAFEPRSEERREEALRLWAEADAQDKLKRAGRSVPAREEKKVPIMAEKKKAPAAAVPLSVLDLKKSDEVLIQISRINSFKSC